MSVDDTHTPGSPRNPLLTVELLADVDPCMCWRVTAGDLHACGPTIAAATAVLARLVA